MELRELAERVLFATTLEEKLQCPAIITDARPGPAIESPAMPGRPKELTFKITGTSRGEFPGTQHLEKERERGRLLHFFANHELLATELMALVLLRFPDAPAAFRKGVLETLKDEQEHTRLYIERMKGCGIQFGELPVSGYFWRAVSGMENPMDYVAGLSLTFEQANLDFARHFSNCFAEVGDADSAKLLQKIYRDEIGHVAYGLKWFRRWKNPTDSDWEAFCRHLKFPLSPSRAKGFSLNVEGRRAAGLGLDFIEHLKVFSQSKGRTPTVFVFNPLTEARLAGGKGFSPTKHQVQLVRDLTNLPQFLCRQDDIVLVEQQPAVHFLSELKDAGFVLPEFVELERSAGHQTGLTVREASRRADRVIGAPLADRKLGGLRPWAWGPDSVELFQPLFASVTSQQQPPEARFNEQIAALYSKAWSAAFLHKFLQSLRSPRRKEMDSPSAASPPPHVGGYGDHWLCSDSDVGMAVESMEAALDAIAGIRSRGHHKVVLKESIGVAGSNALRLFEPDLTENQKRWIANVVASDRQIVVEPWLERELDFSVQLEMTPAGLKLVGHTGLLNDAKGQFVGNWAEPKFERKLPAAVTSWLGVVPAAGNPVQQLYEKILAALEMELRATDFLGPLGIDAFVYRDSSGARRLKPIVEINPRYTMGRVTVELMARAAQGSHGLFRLFNRASLRAEGCEDFVSLSQQLREKFPLHFANDPARRIAEGAVCLNDPQQAQVCLAVFQVFRHAPPFLRRTGVAPVSGFESPA
jgi:uncharacterized ferritin-like protein (DUF455 family)